jgi:hypothetical protein
MNGDYKLISFIFLACCNIYVRELPNYIYPYETDDRTERIKNRNIATKFRNIKPTGFKIMVHFEEWFPETIRNYKS